MASAKQDFYRKLKTWASSLETAVSTKDGQWTIKGFIDVYKNIYTISSDTKIVSKILEIHPFPRLLQFAEQNGFATGINQSTITPAIVRSYLEQEGKLLLNGGKEYYYHVRERFNEFHAPLDFLFLTRAGFNGMIRFNQKGKHNVPSNHKPNRFAKAYVTKVVNQVNYVYDLCRMSDFTFICQDFRKTIQLAQKEDFIYCDPPYAAIIIMGGANKKKQIYFAH